jgi:hypothetical protein
MSSETGAWSLKFQGTRVEIAEKRSQLQPWLPSLLMDMFLKLENNHYGYEYYAQV